MRQVIIHNQTHPLSQTLQVGYCDTFFSRLRGLTFHRKLLYNEGLLLVENQESIANAAIHMLGVNFDLSIFWINTAFCVVDTCLAKSWRPFYMPNQPARYILEIHPDRLADFSIGDYVTFENI